MKSGTSVERYEIDIVDKLRSFEKDGKGQLLELCTIKAGKRQLPFVAFTTGEQVVVTARHHINEFWGPTEIVMKLAESGQEGLTLVPVVDVAHYANSEVMKKGYLEDAGGWGPLFMQDTLTGYKGNPPQNAKNNWSDYCYLSDDCPPYIAAVKRFIDNSKLLVDLHNCGQYSFFFLTIPTGTETEDRIFELIAEEMEARKQTVQTATYVDRGKRLASGVYQFAGIHHNTAIDYTAELGIPNIGVEVPVFSYKGAKFQLRDIGDLVEVTSGTFSNIARDIVGGKPSW